MTANILFSGIGCQERGFREVFDIKVLNTSEINKESVLSYAAVHCDLTNEVIDNYNEYPSLEEMAQYLANLNLGYIPEKNKVFDWFKLIKKPQELKKYWLACKLSNNLGDIKNIKELPYADLWTCSFPCTDISIAGKMKGLTIDSGTRSSLLWEIIRLLRLSKEKGSLPKYILTENVKNLVSKRFIDDFNNLIDVFKDLGFNTYWQILNGKDCGVPQNRERVFIVCIREDIDTGKFTFPKPFDNGIRLKDVLEKDVDDKYYLSEQIYTRFKWIDSSLTKNVVGTTIGRNCNRYGNRDRVYNSEGTLGALLATECKQPKTVLIPNTGFRSSILGEFKIRKLTPRECWKLMGLTYEDYDRAKLMGIADIHLYKQAGNGIITNCCSLIAEHLYKSQYNNDYICTDENFILPPSGVISVCGEIGYLPAALKYQRTEYAKKIRKDYESGKIKERRCNMREYTFRTDGICNTITTVLKDNYIAVGVAMQGRYNSDGRGRTKD